MMRSIQVINNCPFWRRLLSFLLSLILSLLLILILFFNLFLFSSVFILLFPLLLPLCVSLHCLPNPFFCNNTPDFCLTILPLLIVLEIHRIRDLPKQEHPIQHMRHKYFLFLVSPSLALSVSQKKNFFSVYFYFHLLKWVLFL